MLPQCPQAAFQEFSGGRQGGSAAVCDPNPLHLFARYRWGPPSRKCYHSNFLDYTSPFYYSGINIRKILGPIKIKSALPPPQTQNAEFCGHGFSCRKNAFFQADLKLGQPFPAGPRIADKHFADTFFFCLISGIQSWFERAPEAPKNIDSSFAILSFTPILTV